MTLEQRNKLNRGIHQNLSELTRQSQFDQSRRSKKPSVNHIANSLVRITSSTNKNLSGIKVNPLNKKKCKSQISKSRHNEGESKVETHNENIETSVEKNIEMSVEKIKMESGLSLLEKAALRRQQIDKENSPSIYEKENSHRESC